MAPSAPPPFSASTIEQVCRILADAVTGPQIPNLIAPLSKTPESPAEQENTKWKRLFNAVIAVQNRQHDGRPLVRIIVEVMTPVHFATQAEFDATRVLLIEKLLLAGLSVREDGKVIRVAAASTVAEAQARADDLRAELTRRQVYPDVLRFCRAELLQQNYSHAVLEACKGVADKVRTLSGQDGDGSPLVDATCSLSSGPRIVFNSLGTEWERSEQTGLATLMKGLFSTFRNPTAHAPKLLWATSRTDALDMLTLASMLHRRLDDATVRQSRTLQGWTRLEHTRHRVEHGTATIACVSDKAARDAQGFYEELRQPDRMTLRFTPRGLSTSHVMRAEDSAEYLRGLVALPLSDAIDAEIAQTVARLRAVFCHGLFDYDLFTAASDLAYLAVEGALRRRFILGYGGRVPFVHKGRTEYVEARSFNDVHRPASSLPRQARR